MGFALTIVYIVLTILSPEQFGPSWANYHVLQYLGGLIFLVSLPNILQQKHFTSSIQIRLLLAFIMAIGISQISNGWLGGAVNSWLRFMPSAALFFFIAANVTTARRLKIVSLALVASCLFVAVESLCGYYWGFYEEMFVLRVPIYEQDQIIGQLLRIRGGGFIHDPNDFAQILEIALTLLFIAWRHGRVISNSLFVLVPAAILLWATYLTHSRGALVGLAVLGLAVARKKLGTTWSLALASLLAVGMLALDFTGGRGISASEGTDRLDAWATGLELFKHAPIFGIGFGSFTDFNEITAHNSFILPLAELGLVGTTAWIGLLVTTIMSLNRLVPRPEGSEAPGGGNKRRSELHTGEGEAEALNSSTCADVVSFEDQFIGYSGNELQAERALVQVVPVEDELPIKDVGYERNGASALPFSDGGLSIKEIGEVKSPVAINSFHEPNVPETWLVIIRLALIAFMTTSWFLSRTYSPTTYLVLGIAAAAIGLERSDTETQDGRRWISVTLGVEVLAITFVYLVVRLRH